MLEIDRVYYQFWERHFSEIKNEIDREMREQFGSEAEPPELTVALAMIPLGEKRYQYVTLQESECTALAMTAGSSRRRFKDLGSFDNLVASVSGLSGATPHFTAAEVEEIKKLDHLDREMAYSYLSRVLFPEDSISRPNPDEHELRGEAFGFSEYTAYDKQMALPYFLDHIVYPYDCLAMWHISSFQPQACLLLYNESKWLEKYQLNAFLKKPIMERLIAWENYVSTELFAMRVLLFNKSLQPSLNYNSQDDLAICFGGALSKLFNYESAGLFHIQDGITRRVWSSGPNAPEDQGKGDFPHSSWRPHGSYLPIFKFDQWNRPSEAKKGNLLLNHRTNLMHQAYHILEIALESHARIVSQNYLRSADEFLAFIKQNEFRFKAGLDVLQRTVEKISLEEPRGTQSLYQLKKELYPYFFEARDGFPHNILSCEKTEMLDHVTKLLENRQVRDAIARLENDLQSIGLPVDRLLYPLSLRAIGRDKAIRLAAGLLKAIAGGGIWAPHLWILASNQQPEERLLPLHHLASKRLSLYHADGRYALTDINVRILKTFHSLSRNMPLRRSSHAKSLEFLQEGERLWLRIKTDDADKLFEPLNKGIHAIGISGKWAGGDLVTIGFLLKNLLVRWEERDGDLYALFNDKIRMEEMS